MDPELQRLLIRVAIIGGAIIALAAGALVIAFRSFSTTHERGRDFRAAVLIAGVLAFVMVCCVVLFRLSLIR